MKEGWRWDSEGARLPGGGDSKNKGPEAETHLGSPRQTANLAAAEPAKGREAEDKV